RAAVPQEGRRRRRLRRGPGRPARGPPGAVDPLRRARRLRHRHRGRDRSRDTPPEQGWRRRGHLPLPSRPRRRGGRTRFRPMRHGLKFDGVAVAGIGMVRFGMYKDTPYRNLARDAGLSALHDAGMTLADVDEAFVGYIQPAPMLGIMAMKELGLTGLPLTHIENASATGLVAFREAAWAVSSGRADVAMALCFDKFTDMTGTGGRGAGRDVIDAPILPAAYFALWAQRRMHDRWTT